MSDFPANSVLQIAIFMSQITILFIKSAILSYWSISGLIRVSAYLTMSYKDFTGLAF
jgi:hypothetical protein